MPEGKSLDGKIKEALDQAIRNIWNDENLTDQSVRAYFGILEQFEAQGHVLPLYRATGEEMRRRLLEREEAERAAAEGDAAGETGASLY